MLKYPGKVFRKGDKRIGLIKEIQLKLNEHGCGPIGVDGDFWTKTIAAVKLFQTRRDLEPDGEVGPTTWAELFEEQVDMRVKPATALQVQAIMAAQSQVGTRETKGKRNRGPEVDAYLTSAGYDPTKGSYAWCAAFVYWCHMQATKVLNISNPCPRTGGSLAMWAKASTMVRIPASDAYDDPTLVQPGAIFIIDHGEGLGHVGIVKAVYGSQLITIEGNTNVRGSREGDGVYEKSERKVKQVNVGFLDFSRDPSLHLAAA